MREIKLVRGRRGVNNIRNCSPPAFLDNDVTSPTKPRRLLYTRGNCVGSSESLFRIVNCNGQSLVLFMWGRRRGRASSAFTHLLRSRIVSDDDNDCESPEPIYLRILRCYVVCVVTGRISYFRRHQLERRPPPLRVRMPVEGVCVGA